MKPLSKFVLMIAAALLLVVGTVVPSRMADAQQPRLALPVLVVNTGNLNVRSGPGPQFSVIAVAPGGTVLPVLGTNSDNSWYLVAASAGAGWVDVSFTLARGNFAFVPLVRVPPPAPVIPVNQPATLQLPGTAEIPVLQPQIAPASVIVNTGNLNARSGPGPQYTVIAVLPGGTTLTPLGVTVDNLWYLVEGTFGRGWVSAQFTVFRGSFASVPVLEY